MTHPSPHRPTLLLGLAAAAAAILVAACGTGPIPGQSASSSNTTSSSSSSSSSSGGCSAATAQTAVTVDATDALKFTPASVCLKAGGTVTWKNVGNIFHTTTDEASLAANSSDAAVPSGASGWNQSLNAGQSFSLKLTVPGTYKYFCIPHESLGMLGQITVVS